MPSCCPNSALESVVLYGRAAMPSLLSKLGWTLCQLCCPHPGSLRIYLNLAQDLDCLLPAPGLGDLFLC